MIHQFYIIFVSLFFLCAQGYGQDLQRPPAGEQILIRNRFILETAPDWFSEELLDSSLSYEKIQSFIGFSPYEIIIEKNKQKNHGTEILLLDPITKKKKAHIYSIWTTHGQEAKLSQLLLHDIEKSSKISHNFIYDQNGRIKKHTLTGCLQGERGKDADSFTTKIEYREDGYLFRYPNGSEVQNSHSKTDTGYITTSIIKTKDGLIRRKVATISKANQEDQFFKEEQEDDALKDEDSFSFRRWKVEERIKQEDEVEERIIEGAFDPNSREKKVLKKSISRYGKSAELLELRIYDGSGTILFYSTKNNSLSIPQKPISEYETSIITESSGGRIESITGIFEQFQKQFSYDIFGNIERQSSFSSDSEGNQIQGTIRAHYNHRKGLTAKKHEDGTQEKLRYNLDGTVAMQITRDGTVIEFVRDGLGRIKRSYRKNRGSNKKEVTSYTYNGEWLSQIEDSLFGKIEIERDLFGRVVGQRIERPLFAPESSQFTYDGLNRIIKASILKENISAHITQSYTLFGKELEQRYWDDLGKKKTIHYSYSPEELLSSVEVEEFHDKIKTVSFFNEEGRISKECIEALDNRFTPYTETISYQNSGEQLIKTTFSELGFQKEERYNLHSGKKEFYRIDRLSRTPSLSNQLITHSQTWDWKDIYGSCELTELFVLQSGQQIQKLHSWRVNHQNKIIEITSSDGLNEQYSYDTHGKMSTKRLSNGITLNYQRNKSGQITQLFSSDGSIAYHYRYNKEGLLTEAFDALSQKKVTRSFSPEGVLLKDGEEGETISFFYTGREGTKRSIAQIQLFNGDSIHYLPKDDGSYIIQKKSGFENSLLQWEKTIPILRADKPSLLFQDHTENGVLFQKKQRDSSTFSTTTIDIFGSISQENDSTFFDYELSLLPSGDLISYTDRLKKKAIEVEIDQQGRTTQYGDLSFSYNKTNEISRYKRAGDEPIDIEYTYDALQRIVSATDHINKLQEIYRYDGLHRIQSIDCLSLDGQKEKEWTQKRFWFGFTEIATTKKREQQTQTFLKIPSPQLDLRQTALIEADGTPYRAIEDEVHSIIGVETPQGDRIETARWDLFGQSTETIENKDRRELSPWLFRGNQKIAFGSLYDFGLRRYMPQLFHWVEKDPLGIGDGIYFRSFLSNMPLEAHDPNGLFSIREWSNNKIAQLKNGFDHISKQIRKSAIIAIRKLDEFTEFQSLFEDTILKAVSEPWMTTLGYNPNDSYYGCVGDISKNRPNLRITHINGILNASKNQVDNASLVSLLHSNYPVYYVYSATTGFTGDILRSASSKVGVISKSARILAALWKNLIKEMGEVENKTIIHYAHSLGATETAIALQFLTKEEQSYLHIITFGAATLLKDNSHYNVSNYISVKDGIPMFIDPISYIGGLLGKRNDIYFLESNEYPLIDHLFTGNTYQSVLEDLGLKFQQQFLQSETKNQLYSMDRVDS